MKIKAVVARLITEINQLLMEKEQRLVKQRESPNS